MGTGSERRCILVVEDDAIVLRICRAVLEREGYTVLAAANANEARKLTVPPQCIALALIDLVVPGGSSASIIEGLRDAGMTGPVVCMSGYPENLVPGVDNPRALSSFFLAKPFTPDELTMVVRSALNGV
jgi:DNA-binding NtrC family response regulator